MRLRAVQKHPSEDTDTLAELARRDPDPRVRKEAVRRIDAPRVLLSLVDSAGDQTARRLARSRSESLLVKIASDDRDLAESRRALALLTPLRGVAEVVCRARFEALRQEAMERLLRSPEAANGRESDSDDGREAALARVAGRAAEPSLRGLALGAIGSPSGLAQVAVSAEAREAAQAAVRRLEDADLLLTVANSNAPKSVRRLARRRAEERLPEDHPERVRAREASLAGLLVRLEDADPGRPEETAPLFSEAEALAAAGTVSPSLVGRLEAARERSRPPALDDAPPQGLSLAMTSEPDPPPPAAEPPRPVPEELLDLLARLEDPESGFGVQAVDAAEKEAKRLLAGFAEDSAPRARCRSAVREARTRALARRKRRIEEFQLAELADHGAGLLESLKKRPSGAELGQARRELMRLTRRFERMTVQPGGPMEKDAARFRTAIGDVEALLAAAEGAREEKLQGSRDRLAALETRLDALETEQTLSVADAEAALRELGILRHNPEVWRHAGPARQARLQRQQAKLLPRLREARELREWRHWSNLEEQAQLIRRARALAEVADDARVDRELAALERSWREVRHTGREQGQELWEEWGTVRDTLLERVAPLREARERALAEKRERLSDIAEKAEEIADSLDPARADEMRALMSDWRERAKGVGKKSEPLWKRFRTANDRYFGELKGQRKKRLAELEANLPIREELIRRARALLTESDAGAVRNAVRGLMREWKEAPPIPRKQGDRLWEDFCGACDAARDRVRDGVRNEAADGNGRGDAAGGGEAEGALRARISELSDLPLEERVGAAEAVWGEYRRLRRRGGLEPEAGAGSHGCGEALLGCLREAYERIPESFIGTRFDQEVIGSKLAVLLRSLEPLAATAPRAPTETSVVTLAEHLQRSFRQGRAADRDAEAREAGQTAGQILERAHASGPALAASVITSLARIEKLAKKVISRAPPPPVGRERGKDRRPRRRSPDGNGGAPRKDRRRVAGR